MKEKNNDDNLLSQLMQKSLLEMPFSDFEETIMLKIQEECDRQEVVLRDRKLSFFFFMIGTGFGLTLNVLLQRSRMTLLQIPSNTLLLLFQVGFVLLFLIQLDKNISFLKHWLRSKNSLR